MSWRRRWPGPSRGTGWPGSRNPCPLRLRCPPGARPPAARVSGAPSSAWTRVPPPPRRKRRRRRCELAEDEGPSVLEEGSLDPGAEAAASFAATSEAVSTSEALPEESLENATPELPAKVVDFQPGANVPVLAELASAVALAGASEANPFRVGRGSFSVLVKGELLTRLEGLVAFSGQLQFEPELKRFRGRTSEQPFGEGARQLVRATGEGVLFIESAEGRSFLAVELGEEGAYLREEFLFAFEEAVTFENGKVPSDVAPDLELVLPARAGEGAVEPPREAALGGGRRGGAGDGPAVPSGGVAGQGRPSNGAVAGGGGRASPGRRGAER